jgi:hypothetical protein
VHSFFRSAVLFPICLMISAAVSACGAVPIAETAFTTTTWYVATGGDDAHDCLTPGTACRTIDAALTKAVTGLVVIQVGPGRFEEITHTADPVRHTIGTSDGVHLQNRFLTLRGTVAGGALQTSIGGQWGLNGISIDGVSDVTIQDLLIDNGGTGSATGLLIAHGGGGSSVVTVRNVTVVNNGGTGIQAFGNPQITLDGVTVRGNGAGISVDGGRLTVVNSRITDNRGIGIINSSLGSGGETTIRSTTISGNVGTGVDNALGGGLRIESSTVSGTRPASAGEPAYGIYSAGSLLTVFNSTVSGNPTGIQSVSDLVVSFTTVAENIQFGIYAGSRGSAAAAVWIGNSVVENNGRQDCLFDVTGTRPGVTAAGTVLSDGSCGPRGFGILPSRTGGDTLLGALADNGGPTMTQALLPGSAAIDAAAGDCPAADQRGIARPQAAACDAGAYELEVSPRSLILPAIPTPTAPAATPTQTPTPTAPALTFGSPAVSSGSFYFGKGTCTPTTLTVGVSVSDPAKVANLLLFFRLQDVATGGLTPWSNGVSMRRTGAGAYEYTLESYDIPGYAASSEATFLYQFAALGQDGAVLLRSDVFRNVTLYECKK